MTVAEASHDMETANMKASMEPNNGPETNSNYTLSQNTMNTKQIDIAFENKVSSEIANSPIKGGKQNST